jgi:hypothetical protein
MIMTTDSEFLKLLKQGVVAPVAAPR